MGVVDSLKTFGKNLMRLKPPPENPLASDLSRCLGLLDLTFLSIGAMVGVGIFVTIGQISREAGPSIVLSYVLGGIASLLSALCYAELAARVPIAGSSYQFTYMTMGEFWGFFVGWNIALEHAIGSAAISRAVSGYIDSLFNNVIRNYLVVHTPMMGGFFATYPDFLAAGYIIMIMTLIAFGIKLSSRTNIFFATLNLSICGFIVISAIILGDPSNLVNANDGGFFPHGFSATLTGAATLIFAYIGYEVVGAAAEEAKNPRRNIPLSLIISILLVILIYVSVSISFVSLIPWNQASVNAPFSRMYKIHGWYWAKYLISVGIIVASSAANIAASIAIPRYLFSMARDGLMMKCFGKVNSYTEVPVNATILAACLCVLLALIFSLKELIEFMSIGQLIACIFVAMSVIKLRYKPFGTSKSYESVKDTTRFTALSDETSASTSASESTRLVNEDENLKLQGAVVDGHVTPGTLRASVRSSKLGSPLSWTDHFNPGNVPVTSMFVAAAFSAGILAMLIFDFINMTKWWFITLITVFGIIVFLCLTLMVLFAQDETINTYKIPFAPVTPFVSIVINIALMMKLPVETWIRLGVWMVVGLVLYGGYGYSHSRARKDSMEKAISKEDTHQLEAIDDSGGDSISQNK